MIMVVWTKFIRFFNIWIVGLIFIRGSYFLSWYLQVFLDGMNWSLSSWPRILLMLKTPRFLLCIGFDNWFLLYLFVAGIDERFCLHYQLYFLCCVVVDHPAILFIRIVAIDRSYAGYWLWSGTTCFRWMHAWCPCSSVDCIYICTSRGKNRYWKDMFTLSCYCWHQCQRRTDHYSILFPNQGLLEFKVVLIF